MSRPRSAAELIRELIDRAVGGHPGADLAADLAAIDNSFGILAGRAVTLMQEHRRSEPPARIRYEA